MNRKFILNIIFFLMIYSFKLYAFYDTLAIVNDKVISSEEFIQFYKDKLIRYGLNDTYDLRIKSILNLVNDELLIAEAKKMNLHVTEKAKKEFIRIQTQELLNAYANKYISQNINITEDDLKDLFIKLNTKIKVRHLYAPTKEKADSLFNLLKRGISFEELARVNFKDPVLKESGGLLGYISIDEMDPEFEAVSFSLNPGEISKPVKTVYGYSIIKVEDKFQNPFNTEYEFLKSKEKLKAFARKKAFEKSSKNFAQMLRKKLKTKFNKVLLRKFFYSIQNDSMNFKIEDSRNISKDDMNKIVVTSTLENWNLKKLIDEFNNIPDKQRIWIRSLENLEDFIAGLINRKYIILQAKKEKLIYSSSFRKSVEFNFDTYLLSEIEEMLKNKIVFSEDSIKNYYEKNKNLFRTKPLIKLSSILIDDSTLVDTIIIALNNGTPFESLSKKYSIQKIPAERGGDIGYFSKEELFEYGDKIFSMKIGEWMGPLTNGNKYLFLKCTDFRTSSIITYDEVYEQIKEQLKYFEWIKVRNEYVQSLKNKFNYKIFTEKLKYIKIINNS